MTENNLAAICCEVSPCSEIEIELMFGKRDQKKEEVVRIDVDWLLGESTHHAVREFPWFHRISLALICALAVVWCWPFASRTWLNWELQQQLADLSKAPKLNASLDPMLVQGDLFAKPFVKTDRDLSTRTDAPIVATQFRISDDSYVAGVSPGPETVATASSHVLTSMRTLTDHASSRVTSQLPNLNLSIPRTLPNAMVVRTAEVLVQPTNELELAAESPAYQHEPNSINGIEKLELEKLLPLLNSSQTRIERQAFNELVRRETSQSTLELAIVLAQGETEERLRAMETIARDAKIDAIPWLVWMAGNADRSVRRRAISLLGSMTNPDALRKLRVLQSREPDSAIFDQIDRVLLASGSASKSLR